jgi:hypothetical protein
MLSQYLNMNKKNLNPQAGRLAVARGPSRGRGENYLIVSAFVENDHEICLVFSEIIAIYRDLLIY